MKKKKLTNSKSSGRIFDINFAWLIELQLRPLVFIKWPILVLFAFCQKIHSIQNFSIVVHSQPFEIFVVSAVHSKLFKITL